MCDLKIEKVQEDLERTIDHNYLNILYILSYNYKTNEWDFTLINPRKKTIYLPFNYKKKKINFSFYYQFLYRKLKNK